MQVKKLRVPAISRIHKGEGWLSVGTPYIESVCKWDTNENPKSIQNSGISNPGTVGRALDRAYLYQWIQNYGRMN